MTGIRKSNLLIGMAIVGLYASHTAFAAGNRIVCHLTQRAGPYIGNCVLSYDVHEFKIGFDGRSDKLGYHALKSEVPTDVATTLQRKSPDVWQGTLVGRRPEDPTLFILRLKTKVAETPYGWYPIKSFNFTGSDVDVNIDATRLAPPSLDDLHIISETKSLLSRPGVWSQTGTRDCDPEAKSYDLFCALHHSTIKVTGTFQYRQPAMQIVRAVVDEIAASEISTHRLMEYNNARTTTLADIQHVLDMAYARLQKLMHS
uniref:Uncharacterized protein n=1 Tax=Burkholderia sp. (strain CCGE1003) TaxID=640512 RepID=E1TIK9_BURSG